MLDFVKAYLYHKICMKNYNYWTPRFHWHKLAKNFAEGATGIVHNTHCLYHVTTINMTSA